MKSFFAVTVQQYTGQPTVQQLETLFPTIQYFETYELALEYATYNSGTNEHYSKKEITVIHPRLTFEKPFEHFQNNPEAICSFLPQGSFRLDIVHNNFTYTVYSSISFSRIK